MKGYWNSTQNIPKHRGPGQDGFTGKFYQTSVNEGMNKETVVYMCTRQYYSTIKRMKPCHAQQPGQTSKGLW